MNQTNARQHAFSLVEMMVVLAIIVMLLLALSSLLTTARRTAWLASCGSNLNQIFQAHSQASMDMPRSTQVVMNRSGWVTRLSPYLDKSKDVFACPEDPLYQGGSEFNFHMGFLPTKISKTPDVNKIAYILSFQDAGPDKLREISVEQYEELGQLYDTKVVSGGGIKGTKANLDWWKKNMEVRPGSRDPHTTWLVLEPDAFFDTNTYQFHDYLVKVERLDGGTRLTPMRGSRNSGKHEYGWFVDENGNDILNPPGQLIYNETSRHVMIDGDSATNYGANPEALYRTTDAMGKILAIDYRSALVDITTWHQWDDADGMPGFARHPGNTLNVLLQNGAVQQAHPDVISPVFINNQIRYWNF